MLISNQRTVFHQKRLNLLALSHYQIFQKIYCHLQQSIQNLFSGADLLHAGRILRSKVVIEASFILVFFDK